MTTGKSRKKQPAPKRRIHINIGIDPDDEHRLSGDPVANKHMRNTYFITKRFAELLADMTEAGESDGNIVVAAHDVAVNVLRMALQAIIARSNIHYDKAPALVDGVLDEILPLLRQSVQQTTNAWIITSQAINGATRRN